MKIHTVGAVDSRQEIVKLVFIGVGLKTDRLKARLTSALAADIGLSTCTPQLPHALEETLGSLYRNMADNPNTSLHKLQE